MNNVFNSNGDGAGGGGFGIGVSQPSSGGGFTNSAFPVYEGAPGNGEGIGGVDTGGTQFADLSSTFGGGTNGGTNVWGDQQQQHTTIINHPGSGVSGGSPLFPYATSGTTTPSSTWASFNGGGGGSSSTSIGDDYIAHWRNIPGKNSFQVAPGMSIVILGTLFALSAVVLTRIAKNVRFGIVCATSLTLPASLCFVFDLGEDSIVSCQDVWGKNLGIGVLFGLLLALTFVMGFIFIFKNCESERDRQAYLKSGMPLQGTIVLKSIETVKGDDRIDDRYLYNLHIRYNDMMRGMSSLTKTHCSSTNICQEMELVKLQKKAPKLDSFSTISTSFGMESAEECDLCHHKETQKTIQNPLQKEKSDDAFPDIVETSMHSPGDTNNVHGYQFSTDVEGQHQKEEAIAATNILPFQVKKQIYDESEIGDSIELLQMPGNPSAIRVKKSQLRPDYEHLCAYSITYPLIGYILPIGLGFYLPIRILNWQLCRKSVIVCMSSMVITCVLILHLCGCLHFSMSLSYFVDKIQQCRSQFVEKIRRYRDRNKVKESHNIALASLQEKVVWTTETIHSGSLHHS